LLLSQFPDETEKKAISLSPSILLTQERRAGRLRKRLLHNSKFCLLLDRIYWIFWIIFLYLKFPEEIPNEQSATPKREANAIGDVATIPLF